MREEIIEKLSKFIAIEVMKRPNLQLSKGDRLISSGLIDSFHLVDLALFVEGQYSVKIDDMELNAETFDTLDELADLVISKMASENS